jgi:hypothetical protein
MTQLETAVEVIKDRGSEAVEAIQHSVEAIGTRLGVIEPPKRRRMRPWVLVSLGALAVVAVVMLRRKRMPMGSMMDRRDERTNSSEPLVSGRR